MRHRPFKILAPVAGLVIAVVAVSAAGCGSGHYRRYDAPYGSDGYGDRGYDGRDSEGYEYREGSDQRFRRDGSRGGDVFTLAAELDERSSRLALMATGHRGQERRHSENELEGLTRKFARRATDFRTNLQHDSGRGSRRDVEKLSDLARDIDAQFREARMPQELSGEWNAVLRVLDRLQRSLGGYRR